MKTKPPYQYERVRFYNPVEGKHQFVVLAKVGNRIVKYRFEK